MDFTQPVCSNIVSNIYAVTAAIFEPFKESTYPASFPKTIIRLRTFGAVGDNYQTWVEGER